MGRVRSAGPRRWAPPTLLLARAIVERSLPAGIIRQAVLRVKNASHGADGWRYLSISWRAPMREPEPEQKPAGISLPGLTMDQWMDIEDSPSRRPERV